jgi:hypothetical protein
VLSAGKLSLQHFVDMHRNPGSPEPQANAGTDTPSFPIGNTGMNQGPPSGGGSSGGGGGGSGDGGSGNGNSGGSNLDYDRWGGWGFKISPGTSY